MVSLWLASKGRPGRQAAYNKCEHPEILLFCLLTSSQPALSEAVTGGRLVIFVPDDPTLCKLIGAVDNGQHSNVVTPFIINNNQWHGPLGGGHFIVAFIHGAHAFAESGGSHEMAQVLGNFVSSGEPFVTQLQSVYNSCAELSECNVYECNKKKSFRISVS